MVKCEKCGVETYMPFRCNYCGGYFCEQHRLPEFHDCNGKYDQTKPKTVQVGEYTTSSGSYGNYSTSRIIRPYWFSKKELRDLAIGLLVIMTLPFFKIWSNFTIDHVKPHSRGGRTVMSNAALRCRRCNSRKGNR